MLVFALVLLLMVLLRPQGIFGAYEFWDLKVIRKFWHPDANHRKTWQQHQASMQGKNQ
jgi:hypothetical protein